MARDNPTIAEFFATVMAYGPPMPDFVDPPLLWGDETHVRELFAGTGVDLELRHDDVALRAPSIADAVELYSTNLGPVVLTRRALEVDGRWPALRDDLSTSSSATTQPATAVSRGPPPTWSSSAASTANRQTTRQEATP